MPLERSRVRQNAEKTASRLLANAATRGLPHPGLSKTRLPLLGNTIRQLRSCFVEDANQSRPMHFRPWLRLRSYPIQRPCQDHVERCSSLSRREQRLAFLLEINRRDMGVDAL